MGEVLMELSSLAIIAGGLLLYSLIGLPLREGLLLNNND